MTWCGGVQSPVPSLRPAFSPCRKQCRSSFPLETVDGHVHTVCDGSAASALHNSGQKETCVSAVLLTSQIQQKTVIKKMNIYFTTDHFETVVFLKSCITVIILTKILWLWRK